MTQKNTRPTGVGYEDLAMIGGSVDNSPARPVQVFKVKTPDGTRFLPLYSTAACGA